MVKSETLAKTNSAFLEKRSPVTIVIAQSSAGQQIMAIDVYGQQIEPICSYRTCHHKFSTHAHNSHICKCHHPVNYAAGVSLRRGCMICD